MCMYGSNLQPPPPPRVDPTLNTSHTLTQFVVNCSKLAAPPLTSSCDSPTHAVFTHLLLLLLPLLLLPHPHPHKHPHPHHYLHCCQGNRP